MGKKDRGKHKRDVAAIKIKMCNKSYNKNSDNIEARSGDHKLATRVLLLMALLQQFGGSSSKLRNAP